MSNKKIACKRERKLFSSSDDLHEDNNTLFKMLQKQQDCSQKNYNLRKKQSPQAKQLRFKEDFEISSSSHGLYKILSSMQKESRKSKVLISQKEASAESVPKTNTQLFSWAILLDTLRDKFKPQQSVQTTNLKRKFETIKSTTISSEGENSNDDSIIEITPKKIDRKNDVIFIGSQKKTIEKPAFLNNETVSNDQLLQYYEALNKLNGNLLQDTNSLLFSSPEINKPFIKFQNVSMPISGFSLQNLNSLSNLNSLNNFKLPNVNSNFLANFPGISVQTPKMFNPNLMFLQSNSLPQQKNLLAMGSGVSDIGLLSSLLRNQINRLNYSVLQNNNSQCFSNIMALLQQNGINPTMNS